ncbi:hypothetical protein [Sphingomonas sp.]
MQHVSLGTVSVAGVVRPVLARARDLRPLVLLLITDDPGSARL